MEKKSSDKIVGDAILDLDGTGSAAAVNTVVPSPDRSVVTPVRADGELSLGDILAQIQQGILIIKAKWYWGALAAIVLGGLLGYALLTKPVEYIAETTMIADNDLDKVLGVKNDLPDDTQGRENSMRNHLSAMQSRSFRTRLLNSFSNDELQGLSALYQKPGVTIDRDWLDGFLDGSIGVERERGREFFTIHVLHLDPKWAVILADRFTEQYGLQVQDEFQRINKQGLEILQKQADGVRAQIAKQAEERLDFRKKNRIISRTDSQGILTDRLRRIDSSLTDARVSRLILETRAARAKADRAESEYPWDNSYLATFADNGVLRQTLSQLNAQRGVLASKYGPNHPKMRDIDASIRTNQENIKRNFDVAVNDLQSQLETARETERQLQREFDAAFDSSIELEKLATRYESIGLDESALLDSLQKVNKQITDAGISASMPASLMRVVDPGSIVKPRVPKKVIYLFATLCVALVAFVTAPLAANLLDERIKSTVDLEALLGKALLGAVPTVKARPEDRAHIVRNRTDSLVTESFVAVAGGLDLLDNSAYPKVISFTSTLPGEGKSMIVSNLSSAYVQLGKRVIVIDLDLRRPTQHVLHSVSSDAGFIAWARLGYSFESLLDQKGALGPITLPDGAVLVTAGGNDPHPSNFLISKQLAKLLETLKSSFDVIILDTPPAGLFQDALVLARVSVQRVLVTRVGKAPVAQVKKVISDFDRAGTPFSGIVVNDFDPTSSHSKLAYGYNSEGYGYKVKKEE